MSKPDIALILRVAEHHRAQLLKRADTLREDQSFVTGCTWSVSALDRVIRACKGVTEPTLLGLTPAKPTPAPEQPDLFSLLGETT